MEDMLSNRRSVDTRPKNGGKEKDGPTESEESVRLGQAVICTLSGTIGGIALHYYIKFSIFQYLNLDTLPLHSARQRVFPFELRSIASLNHALRMCSSSMTTVVCAASILLAEGFSLTAIYGVSFQSM